MTMIDEMVAAAAAYAEGFTRSGTAVSHHRSGAPARSVHERVPRRKVTVIACMDSRLDLFSMFALQVGDAHILRNAGGTVTSDTLRSLVISQHFLGTRETVLVHHTDCGMTNLDEGAFLDQLEHESGIRPEWSLLAFSDAEQDVRDSLNSIRRCPWLISTSARGFVFDVEGGKLAEVKAPE